MECVRFSKNQTWKAGALALILGLTPGHADAFQILGFRFFEGPPPPPEPGSVAYDVTFAFVYNAFYPGRVINTN